MKYRITPDGQVVGLWSDCIDWRSVGRVRAHRASHVEFDLDTQMWQVRSARRVTRLTGLLRYLLRRSDQEVLYESPSREEALAWEHAHFEPGGPGWKEITPIIPRRQSNGYTARSEQTS